MIYNSQKVYDGFSCCFRQWRATGTHCSFLHGYGISFEVTYSGQLDERNWVMDFGGLKRAKTLIDGKNPKDWMTYMFDHTTIIAEDDPYLHTFEDLAKYGLIQLRILPNVGAERFAEYIHNKLHYWAMEETNNRVGVSQVKFMEHEKNSAKTTYTEG